jgi:hypothetical protein
MATDLPAGLWPSLHRLAGGERWPPASPAAAEAFVDAAAREGLLPLLAAAPGLPASVAGLLPARRALVALAAARAAIQARVLAEVLGILGGEIVLLKGADYARRLYASPELRPMADLDLLVRPARFLEARDRLLAHGFEVRYPAGPVSRLPSHHEVVLVRSDAMVEVHQAFTQKARYPVDYEALWARAVPAAGLGALRLADPDALAYQGLSMACDELSVSLLRHVDLWLLLRQPGALPQAVERARAWRARRALYAALRQQDRLLPGEGGPELEAAMQALLPAATRAFLDARVITALDERGDRRRRRHVWIRRKLLLLDDNRRRLAFVLDHAAALLRAHLRRPGPAPLGPAG